MTSEDMALSRADFALIGKLPKLLPLLITWVEGIGRFWKSEYSR